MSNALVLASRWALVVSCFSCASAFADPNLVARCSIRSYSSFNRYSYDAGSMRCVIGSQGCESGLAYFDSLGADKTLPAVLRDYSTGNPPGPQSSAACVRRNLSPTISWISSAVWIEGRDEIAVVNPLENKLLRVSPSGRVNMDTNTHRLASREPFVPVRVEKLGSNYVLILDDATAILFDPIRSAKISTGVLEESARRALGSLTDCATVGDEIVGYGSTPEEQRGRNGNNVSTEQSALGFIRLKATVASPLKVAEPRLLLKFPSQKYYLLGHRYVAANDLGAFFVTMETPATIHWYSPKTSQVRRLSAFPKQYQVIEPLTTVVTRRAHLKDLFGEVENATIPVGPVWSG